MTRLEGYFEKVWGGETIFANNDRYCGKVLNFNTGSKFSMHFHREKDETWFIISGEFVVRYVDTNDANMYEEKLSVGDRWHNPPLLPHQLICVQEGSIIEVSTSDNPGDTYRIVPGDTQKSENVGFNQE